LVVGSTVGCACTTVCPAPTTAARIETESSNKQILGESEKPSQLTPVKLVSAEPERERLPTPQEKPSTTTSQEHRAGRPITLLSVLEVVQRDNPNIMVARHRVEEAYAQWQRADVLWLPSIRAGLNYNKHEGRIQDVLGGNVETSR
jgi:hypothetical protein